MSKAEFVWFVGGLLLGAAIMLFVVWLGEHIDGRITGGDDERM